MVVEFIQNLLELVQQIRPGHQTLTHYGFSGDELTAFAHNCVLSGLSRIVPIGQALNFDAVWDGYDLLRELTRTIRLGLEVRFALMSVKENAYHLLRRLTPQRQRERVKARISQARRAAAPILKKWYGTFGDDDLERALREKMPGGFEILMVHSSITHLQPMYDGDARSLLELMFRIAGPEATLAMPAFFFGSPELFLLQKASQVRCPACTFSDGTRTYLKIA